MDKPIKIACYLTTHGYGHAVRSGELIYQFARSQPSWFFFIVCGAPEFLFQKALSLPNVFLRSTTVDFGLIQNDPRKFCLDETASQLENLISDFGAVVERERTFLQREHIDAIYADIPFIPFEAAASLNIPSIGLGNFSWDWIYYYYQPHNPVFANAAQLAFSCYQKCGLYLTLPFSPPPKAFPNTKPIPLICRATKLTQPEAKTSLGITDHSKKVALIGFSELKLSTKAIRKIEKIKDTIFLLPSPLKIPISNGIQIESQKIDFPIITKASDCIISKPGYGIVSDAVAANIPLILTERGDFPEVPYLEQMANDSVGAIKIKHKNFESGNWKKILKKIYKMKKKRNHSLPPNGTAEAIKLIKDFLNLQLN